MIYFISGIVCIISILLIIKYKNKKQRLKLNKYTPKEIIDYIERLETNLKISTDKFNRGINSSLKDISNYLDQINYIKSNYEKTKNRRQS